MRHIPSSPNPNVLAGWQKGFKNRKMGKTSEMSSQCKLIIAVVMCTDQHKIKMAKFPA